MRLITLTRADAGRIVDVHTGDHVAFEFDEPVTAYRWITDHSGVSRTESPFPEDAPGAGGRVTFEFRPSQPGIEKLSFRFEDQYSGDVDERETFTLRITDR